MKQREGIKAIAMDMLDPYLASIREYAPRAEEKVVFDRYHLMTHMGKAVDTVRTREHGVLKKGGDEMLKGSKYLRLYAQENPRELWSSRLVEWARHHFRRWHFRVTHSRLEPVIKMARMFRKYLENIMTYFIHPITKIQTISLKTIIYFHCGGLQLYPVTH